MSCKQFKLCYLLAQLTRGAIIAHGRAKRLKKTVYTTVRFMKFKMASPCPFQNNSPVDKAESMTSSSLRRYRVIPSTDASTWMPTSKTERKFFRRSSSRNRLVSSLRCSHTRTGR